MTVERNQNTRPKVFRMTMKLQYQWHWWVQNCEVFFFSRYFDIRQLKKIALSIVVIEHWTKHNGWRSDSKANIFTIELIIMVALFKICYGKILFVVYFFALLGSTSLGYSIKVYLEKWSWFQTNRPYNRWPVQLCQF